MKKGWGCEISDKKLGRMVKRVEINRVGKRRRACTAGDSKKGWRVRERELQRAIESVYGVCLKP